MIYGATGRCGELIARQAAARGLRPVLAGRNPENVQRIAEELDLSWRAFEVGNLRKLRREMSGFDLLVNAAGPLIETSVLIAESCLAVRAHYIDLSNQLPSLVAIYMFDAQAKERDLTFIPGLAFSPAASNFLVKYLHTLLPTADAVDIVLDPFVPQYRTGANLTIFENIAAMVFRRRGGRLEGHWRGGLREFALPIGKRTVLPAAVGDIEAAYRCTSIPNIAAYIIAGLPPVPCGGPATNNVGAAYPARPEPSGQASRMNGDSEYESANQSLVWARMLKVGQAGIEGWLHLGSVREFTAAMVVAGVSRLLDGKQVSTGAHAPASALGIDFILDLPNVERIVRLH